MTGTGEGRNGAAVREKTSSVQSPDDQQVDKPFYKLQGLRNNVDKAALESATEMSDFGLNEFSAWTQTGKSPLQQMILVHFKLVICLHAN